jgi:hypothetical protein
MMKARFTFALVLEFFLLITLSPADAAVLKGPYLIYDGLDNTQMTVLWQLDGNQQCTIRWGPTQSYGSSDVTSAYGDNQYSYTISGLTPGAKYYYQVDSVGSGSFYAAPANNATSVKFLAYGDTRTYPADQDAVCAEMINTYTNIDSGSQTICLHVGDWVSNGNIEENWADEFFDPAYSNINRFQSEVALNGCVGNHEFSGGTLFDKYFPYPYATGSNFYWSFEYGPAYIAIVDQYTTSYISGSAQYNWLKYELANTTKEWKFIVLHEPGFSAGGGHVNDVPVQENIQPLCLAYGVDIVFAGHNHYYARCDVAGVQHITTGGGGAPVYPPNTNYPYVVAAEDSHHFCEIDIQDKQLSFTAHRTDGSIIDAFDITHSDPEPTENLAIADLPVKGTILGDYEDTHSNDDVYEEITETQSGGGQPKNLRSSLEHKWIFDVTGGGTITFGINAYCTDAGESDEFIFSYSTDDSTYNEMLWINSTTDEGAYLTYTLPSSISGPVYIRVQDADQTRGNGTLDTLYVDNMYIYESLIVTPHEVYVYDISMDYKVAGPNRTGIATIRIKDLNGADVQGATVYGDWFSPVTGVVSGITGFDGKVTLQSSKVRNGGIFTFIVSDVDASGYTYNPSLNVETSDSINVP